VTVTLDRGRPPGGRQPDPEIGRVPGDKIPEQVPERDPRDLPKPDIDIDPRKPKDRDDKGLLVP